MTVKGSCLFPRQVAWLTTVRTPRDTWLQLRKDGIGGSEVAAIMGESPFTTPWEVWAVKTGRLFEAPPDERAEWGTVLEDAVARKWADRWGVKVRRLGMVADPVHPHRRASLDRAVMTPGTHRAQALLEVKTTSERSGRLSDEELRDRYNTQVQWYLGITGLELAHLAVLVGGQELRSFTIQTNPGLFERLCTVVDNWWRIHVEGDEPPFLSPLDTAVLNRVPEVGGTVVADEQLLLMLSERAALKRDIAELQQIVDLREAGIKQALGERSDLLHEDGTTLATWRTVTSTRLDSKRLRDEEPDTYQRYQDRTQTRRFLVREPKNGAQQ